MTDHPPCTSSKSTTPAPSRSSATPDAPTPPRPSPPDRRSPSSVRCWAARSVSSILHKTPWHCAMAGGQRTISLHAATAAGQLAL